MPEGKVTATGAVLDLSVAILHLPNDRQLTRCASPGCGSWVRWQSCARGHAGQATTYYGRSGFTDCAGWVLCKLWDTYGICEILWTIFADDEKLV